MVDEKPISFLYIPISNWWTLRKKFDQKFPTSVSVTYLAGALNVSAKSASNLLPQLKAIGLIDDQGKPTERANQWRSDSGYAQVCLDILDEVYPKELRELHSTSDSDVQQVKEWVKLKSKGRIGDLAAKNMANFYLLLLDGDPNKPNLATNTTRVAPATPRKTTTKTRPIVSKPNDITIPTAATPEDDSGTEIVDHKRTRGLSIHIDLQIHISPEASAEQIDKIFESMAKHLSIH